MFFNIMRTTQVHPVLTVTRLTVGLALAGNQEVGGQ